MCEKYSVLFLCLLIIGQIKAQSVCVDVITNVTAITKGTIQEECATSLCIQKCLREDYVYKLTQNKTKPLTITSKTKIKKEMNKTIELINVIKPLYYFDNDEEDPKVIFLHNTKTRANISKGNCFVPPELLARRYIDRDGSLRVEHPNNWERWTIIERNNYCVDLMYTVSDNGTITGPDLVTRTIIEYNSVANSQYEYMKDLIVGEMFVSSLFLFVTLLVYFLLGLVTSLTIKIQMSYITSQMLSFLCNAFIQLYYNRYGFTDTKHIRLPLNLSVYYISILPFFWMNVYSFSLWRGFRRQLKSRAVLTPSQLKEINKRKFILYSLYGCGVPAILTVLVYVIDKVDLTSIPAFIKPQIGDWPFANSSNEKRTYVYSPAVILLTVNAIFLVITLYNIWHMGQGMRGLKRTESRSTKRNINKMKMYLTLSLATGTSWFLEILDDRTWQWWQILLVNAYNYLIGIPIFCLLICQKNVLKKIRQSLRKNIERFDSYRTSGGGRSVVKSEPVKTKRIDSGISIESNTGVETHF